MGKIEQYTYKYKYVNITELDLKDIDKIDIARCKDPTQTLEQFYKEAEIKPDVLANGGLFYMREGTPILTLYDENQLYHIENWLKSGIGIVGDKTLIYGNIDNGTSYRDFVTAYPMFIVEGEKNSITFAKELDYNTTRTIIGWNNNKVFIISIGSPGMDFQDIQELLINFKDKEGNKIKYAGNLDGGGSMRKMVQGEVVMKMTSNRPVDNVIAIYLKDENQTEYLRGYRVQLGAFSKKENAENLLKQIQGLGQGVIDYSKAFIKQDGNLYRVQVGFFTKKEGANKVADELNKKGYPTYIKYVEEPIN